MKPQSVPFRLLVAVLLVLLIAAAILLPTRSSRAQLDRSYYLKTEEASQGTGLLSGGRYSLAAVGARLSSNRSSGEGLHLTSLLPANVQQYDYCIGLPVVLKNP